LPIRSTDPRQRLWFSDTDQGWLLGPGRPPRRSNLPNWRSASINWLNALGALVDQAVKPPEGGRLRAGIPLQQIQSNVRSCSRGM
jgi:hypothetical protein